MERIDKILSKELNITRSEAKDLIKHKRVVVNDKIVASINDKMDDSDVLCVDGKTVVSRENVYIMMNKPKGVISSTDGKKTNEKTVIDILPDEFKRKNLFPAGRLDKDTTGFVLITDDGVFAHDILSPKKHVEKTYIASLDLPINDEIIKDFENGITIGDDECMPAKIKTLSDDMKKVEVKISQGMYHQIKRMFKKYGITVLELHRTSMGKLSLDKELAPGGCRYISEEELKLIKNK